MKQASSQHEARQKMQHSTNNHHESIALSRAIVNHGHKQFNKLTGTERLFRRSDKRGGRNNQNRHKDKIQVHHTLLFFLLIDYHNGGGSLWSLMPDDRVNSVKKTSSTTLNTYVPIYYQASD